MFLCSIALPKQQAKVSFDYDADNEDELTIRIGDVVDIIDKNPDGQEGWWEVSGGETCGCVCLGERRGDMGVYVREVCVCV